MRKLTMLLVLVSMMLAVSILVVADTGDSSQAELMQKSMELAQPGPEHQKLDDMTGTWDMHFKMWMEPGQAPMEAKGTSTSRMILGGRFLLTESVSQMWGQTIENLSIMGFDRRHEVYTITAYDVMGTYSVSGKGTAEQDGKIIRLSGEDEDPIFGFTQVYDMVYHFIHADTIMAEVIFKNPELTFGQDEFKMVEVTLTRAKAE